MGGFAVFFCFLCTTWPAGSKRIHFPRLRGDSSGSPGLGPAASLGLLLQNFCRPRLLFTAQMLIYFLRSLFPHGRVPFLFPCLSVCFIATEREQFFLLPVTIPEPVDRLLCRGAFPFFVPQKSGRLAKCKRILPE